MSKAKVKYVVLPARQLFRRIELLEYFIPEGVFLDKNALVSLLSDVTFNGYDPTDADAIKNCIDYYPFIDKEDIDYGKNLIHECMPQLEEALTLANKDASEYVPSFNYLDLVRISWSTRSLYLKVL